MVNLMDMKNIFFPKKIRKDSGIIIIVVLWTMIILTLLAVGLGQNTSVELALAKHSVGKIQSKYAAYAGVTYSIEQLKLDSENEESSVYDTLYFCGLSSISDPNSIFFDHELNNGTFEVSYFENGLKHFGLQDEERRINLNGLTLQNVNTFVSLIQRLGFDESRAKTVSYSIIDWIDADSSLSHQDYGAEEDYYEGDRDSIKVKNNVIESLEEIKLIRGIDNDLFKALNSYITIYPKEKILKVNFNTASEIVLNSLASAYSGSLTNTDQADAESLIQKILEYRMGDDGELFTSDDNVIVVEKLGLNSKENVIFLLLNQFKTNKSDFFRVKSVGTDRYKRASTTVEAIISRENLSIVDWWRQ